MSHEMSTIFPESPSFSLKEIIGCAFLTVVAWVCSFTICFPLLVALTLSPWLRNKSFAFLQSSFMSKIKRYRNIVHYRRKLFDLINDHTSDKRRRSEPLRILEVGVGSGENFEFYPENHSLTTVDMNPEFGSYLRSTLKKYPQIKLQEAITACAEDMSVIKDEEFDVVVTTHLLCSVTDVDVVLNEIYRVLKQGGKFAFFDHVVHSKHHFMPYMIQKIMTPLWRLYFNGCNLDRNILENVNSSRFSEVSCKTYYPDFMDLFFRPHLMAICTK